MDFFTDTFHIDTIHLDATGHVTPAVLLHFVQEAAGKHCLQLALDWDTLAKQGIFWAVIRHRLEVSRLPQKGETIRVETWPMPTSRVAFPRATAGYDEAGNVVFRCMSLWVLMDVKSRQMILPGKSGIDLGGILRGNELPNPTTLIPCSGGENFTRQVWFSELDRNGHMNNTRYLDWAMDLLPPALRREKPLKEATLCYLAEIREGDRIDLVCSYSEEGIYRVDALRQRTDVPDKKERVFSAQLNF